MNQELKNIYRLNSDINKLTGQLKHVNDNQEDYAGDDFKHLNSFYLKQLTVKGRELSNLAQVTFITPEHAG
jgi:hypothetical protein